MSINSVRLACMAGMTVVYISLLGSDPVVAEPPYPIAWTTQIGTAQVDQSGGVAVDGSGYAYMSGPTNGDMDGTSAGSFDAFLSRIDSSGNVVWTKQFGTAAFDGSTSIAADAAGNSYITGRTSGALGGANNGGSDAFLIKIDSSGTQVWARQVGTAERDIGLAVAVDDSGNVYVSGETEGSFGGFSNHGDQDAFLVKYDASGNEQWVRQIGTTESDISEAVAVDSTGNIYISGLTTGDLDGTNAGFFDVFLAKFDSSGNQIWTRQFGTTSSDSGRSVAVDNSGNIFISGNTDGDLDGVNAGAGDAFLAKYDTSGNQVWVRQIGTAGEERGFAVNVDSAGNAFISGFTSGDLGGTSDGSNDVFLAKYDNLGNLLWTDQFGSLGTDEGRALAVDSQGNVYSSGYTNGSLDGVNAGDFDAYLTKFIVPEPASLSLIAVGGLFVLSRRHRI